MAARFTIEAVFKAIDKITAPVTRMGNRVGKTMRRISAGVQRASTSLRKMAKTVGPALAQFMINAAGAYIP